MKIVQKLAFLAGIAFCIAGCKSKNHVPDAYGVFEATEITVSAEGNGALSDFSVQEGATYKKGEIVGIIDTSQLYLQIRQLEASMNAARAKTPNVPDQLSVLQNKLNTLEKEKVRLTNLVQGEAATKKQLDDLNAEITITKSQLKATQSTLGTQTKAILDEIEVMRIQKLQLENALEKSKIKTPIDGIVLKRYIENNELAFQGKPLFKMADLTNMFIKVYISEDMLSSVKLGQPVEISMDLGDGTKTVTGKVSWISPKAEFTPKMIQTKDERVNLVYAVKVSFTNDGSAKIGMPGDVIFK